MAKKIDYASLFTLRKDGRYQKNVKTSDGKITPVYDRDPVKLYERVKALENPAPVAAPTFREIAEAWQKRHWQRITHKTIGCYNSSFTRAIDLDGDRPANEITAGDIDRALKRLAARD